VAVLLFIMIMISCMHACMRVACMQSSRKIYLNSINTFYLRPGGGAGAGAGVVFREVDGVTL
jgi:hypothetical protein